MNRKDFLKGVGLTGLVALLPGKLPKASAKAALKAKTGNASCILIPSETAGPYPWPSSGTSYDSSLIRQDITSGQTGVSLTVNLTIVDINNNCAPIPNAYVSIWHCSKDGHYSEYNTTQNGGDYTAYNFFRGVQITDSNGNVSFTTIVPGWYTPRATHIHVQVFLSSVLAATTQMAFDDTWINDFYTNNATLYTLGTNPTTLANDQVFSDTANTQYEMMTITSNTTTGGYNAALTIGIDMPSSGVINLEPETGGQFKLGVNYPNPFNDVTTIPFTLTNDAHVQVEIYDVDGRKMFDLTNQQMSAGEHTVQLYKTSSLGKLSSGNYMYKITVSNSKGVFRQMKLLSVY